MKQSAIFIRPLDGAIGVFVRMFKDGDAWDAKPIQLEYEKHKPGVDPEDTFTLPVSSVWEVLETLHSDLHMLGDKQSKASNSDVKEFLETLSGLEKRIRLLREGYSRLLQILELE